MWDENMLVKQEELKDQKLSQLNDLVFPAIGPNQNTICIRGHLGRISYLI